MKVINQTAFKMAQEYAKAGHDMEWDIAMSLLAHSYGILEQCSPAHLDPSFNSAVRTAVRNRELKETGCDH